MSLEQKIDDLREAVEGLTKQIATMTSAAKTTTARASAKDKDDKGSEKASDKPSRGRTKKVTSKQIVDAAKAYLDVQDDDEYEARRETVQKIAKRFGVKLLAEIEEADLDEAMKLVEMVAAGENLDEEDEKSSRRRSDDV